MNQMMSSEQINEVAEALALFNTKDFTIVKNRTVQYGKTDYKYADMDDITKVIRKPLGECGLSVYGKVFDDFSKLEMVLLHKSGQWISCVGSLSFPPGSDQKARGAVITYMRRYLLSTLLNLSACEEPGDDPDVNIPLEDPKKKEEPAPANKAEPLIGDKQLEHLESLFKRADERTLQAALKQCGVDSLRYFTQKQYNIWAGRLQNSKNEHMD